MTIIDEAYLIFVSATNNNNKFYHVTLEDNGRVNKAWGRVGGGEQKASDNSGRVGFERIIRQKTNKGYEKTDIVSAVSSSSKAGFAKEHMSNVAKTALVSKGVTSNPVIDALIDRLVTQNTHEIMAASGDMITVDASGQIQTPLGLVSKLSIRAAEGILDELESKPSDVSNIERYLKLIPRKLPARRGWHDDFFTKLTSIEDERDFLKQLSESLEFAKKKSDAANKSDAEKSNDDEYAGLFQYTIDLMDSDCDEFKDIKKMYERSRNSGHKSSGLKLKRVFILSHIDGDDEYVSVRDAIRNEKRLWHGTRAFNVLSILSKGLYVPPFRGGTVQTNGRMFGDGVYLSDQSTKSLNYSYGYWSGARDNNCFMFLADVAMGSEYRPQVAAYDNRIATWARTTQNKFGKPWNSISVKGGTAGVTNNEMIVWDTKQIRLRYLCEFDAA